MYMFNILLKRITKNLTIHENRVRNEARPFQLSRLKTVCFKPVLKLDLSKSYFMSVTLC